MIGRGASFAVDAQKAFNSNFKFTYCVGTPGFSSINVTYEGSGSGAGIKSMQIRTDTPRFAGTDDPPSSAEVALINSGGVEQAGKVVADTDESNDGKVHVFPIAVGSVAPLVNFPDGCDPELLADKWSTIPNSELPGKKALLRVRFTKKLYEEVWSGSKNTKWSDAFPELAGDADCEIGITRVVRFDQSGTSFAFKDYLDTIDPGEGWKTTYATTGANLTRDWPNATFGPRDDCGNKNGTAEAGVDPSGPGSDLDATDHLTSGCANGNGELVKKLVAVDGSIGYSDVATARNASPTLAVNPAGAGAPTTPYWTQVQNGSIAVGSADETNGLGFSEPTADASGFTTTGQKGSNCLAAQFTNVPTTSFGDWSKTSGVNSPTGYGICTLTYALAFDDNAEVWGASPEEEAKARTVKDYEDSILSDAAQGALFGADYARLPDAILATAREDVAEIGWDKAHSGEEEKPVEKPEEKGKENPPPPPPSNLFSFRKSVKNGKGKVSVELPGAGKLSVLGTAKANGKKVTVLNTVVNASSADTFDLTVKPKGAAKAALKEKGKLLVSLKLTFTPTGGTASTKNSSVTLKVPKQK
ncbi:MAG TPA: hypothetical protein VIT85_01050 [Solirubrobacterales bacterium]